jgi:hypothetical protein
MQNLKAILDRQLPVDNTSISDHGMSFQPESAAEALSTSNGLRYHTFSELERLVKEREPHTHFSE